MAKFITLRQVAHKQDENRQSSLLIQPDSLQVIGVLPHSSQIAPASVRDATMMIDWLNKWIEAQEN